MLKNSDEHRPEGFSERRHLADTHEGRADALKDCFAYLHCQVLTGDFAESNGLRAIQIMEKLHRPISLPPVAPDLSELEPETVTQEENDPYTYDHTGLHKHIAEMSDDDILSYMEGLAAPVEHKCAGGPQRKRGGKPLHPGPLSVHGETVPTPPNARSRGGP